MAGALDVAQIAATGAPLVVAALCVFAYRRGLGGRYLLTWAVGHLALALTFGIVAHAEPTAVAPGLDPLWSSAIFGLLVFGLALLFGVLDIETETVGFRRGLLLTVALAGIAVIAGGLDPRILVFLVLPGFGAISIAAGVLLLVRRRSPAYVVAGAILLLRAGNGLLFAWSVRQTGLLDVPAYIAPASIFLNFLTGIALLLVAIDDAWQRLGALLTETRAAKAVSEAILNVAPVSILQKNADLRIVNANPYAVRLMQQLSPGIGNIVGLRSAEMTPGAESRMGEEIDRQLLGAPETGPREYEATYASSSGAEVTLLVRKAALLDENGKAFGTISVSSDISALKRSQAQLLEMFERAEQANRIKTDFLANMSHELRTPLNGISGFADMLAEGYLGALNARQIDYVQNIRSSSRAMLGLVSDILDLSRLTTGQLDLHVGPVDICEVLEAIVAAVQPMAGERGVRLQLECPQIIVEADQRAILQALSNLVDNAIRFNRPGGSVRISATQHDGSTLVMVADTGPGMTPEQIAASGDPFQRGDPLKARPGGGSGLGLAVARGLIEAHGGRLDIESRNGEGCRVTVRI